jgi:hypothetical protein
MKRHTGVVLVLSAIVLFTLTTCKKDKCLERIIAVESLEGVYGCSDTRNGLEINLDNTAIIITNQTDFNDRVSGSCLPVIDFIKYDLLIGRKSTTSIVDTIYYDYRTDCPDMDRIMTVEIIQTPATALDNPVYHALIPKLGGGEGITLSVITR